MILFKFVLSAIVFLIVAYIIFNLIVYFMRKGGGPGSWMTAMARSMAEEDEKAKKIKKK